MMMMISEGWREGRTHRRVPWVGLVSLIKRLPWFCSLVALHIYLQWFISEILTDAGLYVLSYPTDSELFTRTVSCLVHPKVLPSNFSFTYILLI